MRGHHTLFDEKIIVPFDDQHGQRWHRLDQDRKLVSLNNMPATSLDKVYQISISPDDHWMAVISVGEGHPTLDVIDLKQVLNSTAANEEKKSNATIYPE